MRHASFLIVTAIVEGGAGVCLLLLPAIALEVLLGVSQAVPEATLVGRVAGAALLALGVASWFGRNDLHSPAQRGLLTGLLIYNGTVAVLLVYAALGLSMAGIALWPAVGLHVSMAVWCVACLRIKP